MTKEIKCTCGKGGRPGVHRFEGRPCDKVPSIRARVWQWMRFKRITIGTQKPKYPGKFGMGVEFSLSSPNILALSPRMEVYAFTLVSFPPRGEMFNKARDIKGIWKIVWWQPDVVLHQKKLYQRKGFRTRYVTVLVKLNGLFRTW